MDNIRLGNRKKMKRKPRRSFPNLSAQKKLALNRRSLFCLSGEGAAPPPNTLRSSAGFFTITELRACIKKKIMLIRSFISLIFNNEKMNAKSAKFVVKC
jgi:hypothetical protein